MCGGLLQVSSIQFDTDAVSARSPVRWNQRLPGGVDGRADLEVAPAFGQVAAGGGEAPRAGVINPNEVLGRAGVFAALVAIGVAGGEGQARDGGGFGGKVAGLADGCPRDEPLLDAAEAVEFDPADLVNTQIEHENQTLHNKRP